MRNEKGRAEGPAARSPEAIAHAVRVAAEFVLDKHPDCDPRLKGGCFVSSHALVLMLKRRGHGAALVHGHYGPRGGGHNCHCWVELDDGRIIDVTATQFGVPDRVLIVDSHSKYHAEERGRAAVATAFAHNTALRLWSARVQRRAIKELLASNASAPAGAP